MYLDLAELPTLFDNYWLWSNDRPNVAVFTRHYHLGDPAVPLDQAVRDFVTDKIGIRPDGPIRLLTHLQYFGYRFNPVSFFYCFDKADTTVDTIVAEINNTPWGEQHCYVLGQAQNDHRNPRWRHFQFAKNFHVSPFMSMDIQYDWSFQVPDSVLSVHMIDYKQEQKMFDATLKLQRTEITHGSLARVLAMYPFMTLKVVAMIHWQALRLWLKKSPVFPHPAELESEVDKLAKSGIPNSKPAKREIRPKQRRNR
jgi:DUF1365 family protein